MKRKEKWKKGKGGEKRGGEKERESECAGTDRGGRSRVGDKPPSGAGRDDDEEKGRGTVGGNRGKGKSEC
jgi:hypothetical protein